MDKVVAMVEGVKAMGLETCMTLGMLDAPQAADRNPRLAHVRQRL
jgi:biotin synthase